MQDKARNDLRRWRVVIALASLVMGAMLLRAQTSATLPRLPDGRPDFNGVWDYSSGTPLERRKEKRETESSTLQESAASQAKTAPIGAGGPIHRKLAGPGAFGDSSAPPVD